MLAASSAARAASPWKRATIAQCVGRILQAEHAWTGLSIVKPGAFERAETLG
jgi:hypothetical protein